jgi:hypothetical protein
MTINPEFNITSPETEARIELHYLEEDDPNFDPAPYMNYCEVENLTNNLALKCNPGECRSSLLQHLRPSASPSQHCRQISNYALIRLRRERSFEANESDFD